MTPACKVGSYISNSHTSGQWSDALGRSSPMPGKRGDSARRARCVRLLRRIEHVGADRRFEIRRERTIVADRPLLGVAHAFERSGLCAGGAAGQLGPQAAGFDGADESTLAKERRLECAREVGDVCLAPCRPLADVDQRFFRRHLAEHPPEERRASTHELARCPLP